WSPCMFRAHERGVHSVGFAPDGCYILTGSGDKGIRGFVPNAGDRKLRLWDVTTGQCLRAFEGGARSVAFSPDGRFAISGKPLGPSDVAADLALWDMATGDCLRTFKGRMNSVISVAFSPDGRFALSGEQDRRLWVGDVGPGLR